MGVMCERVEMGGRRPGREEKNDQTLVPERK